MRTVEVAVIGAGPAGSAAALLLARRGREVLLVDQAAFPRDKPCGEYLNPAAVTILHRLGLDSALLTAGAREVVGAYLTSPAGREVRVTYPSPIDGPPPRGMSIPRLVLDTVLVGAAQAAGARFRERFRVDNLLRSSKRVAGIVGRGEHGVEEIRARIVLAADGSRSRVGRRLDVSRVPRVPQRIGLVAHYEEVEGDDWVEMHAGHHGYCGLGYSVSGSNVAMVAEPEDIPQLQGRVDQFYAERLAEFPQVARRLAGGRRVGRVLVTGSMSSRAARVSVPGALLVGDAAGFYDPFTGEGISYALRAAELAVDAAEAALGGSPNALSDGDFRPDRETAAPELPPHSDNAREAAAFREYAARRRREFGPRVLVSRAIQAALRRPWLLEAVFKRFQADPSLAQRLIGVTAGLLPPQAVLTPGYLSSLLFPWPANGRSRTLRDSAQLTDS